MDDYAHWFRQSTPYISTHRGQTFVVLLGGDTLAHRNLETIVHDLALLTVLGVRIVIVHGARPQLDAALTDKPSRFHGPRRVTDAEAMGIIHGVHGQLRARIEALFSTGLPTSPLRNSAIGVVSGNFITARPLGILDGVDHKQTGVTRKVHTERLQRMLQGDVVALVAPVGYSPTGTAYNLNADELAADVALALRAGKLLTFLDEAPLTDAEGCP